VICSFLWKCWVHIEDRSRFIVQTQIFLLLDQGFSNAIWNVNLGQPHRLFSYMKGHFMSLNYVKQDSKENLRVFLPESSPYWIVSEVLFLCLKCLLSGNSKHIWKDRDEAFSLFLPLHHLIFWVLLLLLGLIWWSVLPVAPTLFSTFWKFFC
jgi:hypothetical protein